MNYFEQADGPEATQSRRARRAERWHSRRSGARHFVQIEVATGTGMQCMVRPDPTISGDPEDYGLRNRTFENMVMLSAVAL